MKKAIDLIMKSLIQLLLLLFGNAFFLFHFFLHISTTPFFFLFLLLFLSFIKKERERAMDLSNFQLVDTMSDMDMLRTLSNNNQQYNQRQQSIITHNSNNYDQFQQDINLLFQSNTSSPHVDSSFLDYQKNHLTNQSPHYRTTSQPDCYPQEVSISMCLFPLKL